MGVGGVGCWRGVNRDYWYGGRYSSLTQAIWLNQHEFELGSTIRFVLFSKVKWKWKHQPAKKKKGRKKRASWRDERSSQMSLFSGNGNGNGNRMLS